MPPAALCCTCRRQSNHSRCIGSGLQDWAAALAPLALVGGCDTTRVGHTFVRGGDPYRRLCAAVRGRQGGCGRLSEQLRRRHPLPGQQRLAISSAIAATGLAHRVAIAALVGGGEARGRDDACG